MTALPASVLSPFGAILRAAVEATPGAVGGAFAAADGELVDSYAIWEADRWAVLTAHYGIILAHLRSAFGTWHYGSPGYVIVQHAALDVVVYAVDDGYYALLATEPPSGLAAALTALERGVVALRKEMG